MVLGAHLYWRLSLFIILLIVVVKQSTLTGNAKKFHQQKKDCNLRKVGGDDSEVDNFVCVCDKNYCDTLQLEWPLLDDVLVVRTSLAGLRFHKTMMRDIKKNFDENEASDGIKLELNVDTSLKHQEILGFGGATSDSASININSLDFPLNISLVRDYFGKTGLEYNFIRLPLGGADFSLRPYSYDDDLEANQDTDFEMRRFSLAYEDDKFKIPLIKAAMAEANPRKVNVFGSAWTAPKWMKTNNNYVKGTIIGKPGGLYYKAYADYLIRAYEEYKKRGITLWGLTVQNEPIHPLNPMVNFSSMLMSPENQRDFVKMDLGPALRKKDLGPENLHLMTLDDNLIFAEQYLKIVLADEEVYNYTTGIAIHWYYNWAVPHYIITKIKRRYPDKFILSTEACEGYIGSRRGVELGSWRRGITYALDIMKDLKFQANGWVDWNLALDTMGGPNWASNFVDAMVIVNANDQEYYKNPGYYTMAHISKFLPRGSKIISTQLLGQDDYTQLYDDTLVSLGAMTPSNHLVIIILNNHMKSRDISINVDRKYKLSVNVHANSITTIAVANWWN